MLATGPTELYSTREIPKHSLVFFFVATIIIIIIIIIRMISRRHQSDRLGRMQ